MNTNEEISKNRVVEDNLPDFCLNPMTDGKTLQQQRYDSDFNNIKRAAFRGEMPSNLAFYDLFANLSLIPIYSLHKRGDFDADKCKEMSKVIYTKYCFLRKQYEAVDKIYRIQQEEIKRSGEISTYLVKNAGKISDREILIKLAEYMSCKRGEDSLAKILKKKLEVNEQ